MTDQRDDENEYHLAAKLEEMADLVLVVSPVEQARPRRAPQKRTFDEKLLMLRDQKLAAVTKLQERERSAKQSLAAITAQLMQAQAELERANKTLGEPAPDGLLGQQPGERPMNGEAPWDVNARS